MRRLFLASLLTILAVAATARARSVLEPVGRLPADVDVIVAIDDARSFMRSPVGASIIELMHRGGGFGGTRDAWAALANQMGMTSDQAADALLGGQTVFAARWSPGGTLAWAVLTELAPGAERRVRHAFKPVPREIIAGRPVLAAEGGLLQMMLVQDPATPRLLLGTTSDRSVFTELASTLDADPARPFSGSNLFREVRRVGPNADTMVFFRPRDENELWFALVAKRADVSLETNFLIGVPGLAEHGAQLQPWNRHTFEQLSKDAYVVVLDMSEFSWQGEQGAGIGALAGLGLPFRLAPELKALLSDRFALVVRPGEVGPVEVAIGLETVDASEMAQAGDRLLCRYLRAVATDDEKVCKLEGFEEMPPTAVRSVDLSQLVGSMAPFGWKTGPHVTWGSRVEDVPCNAGQHHGWWTVGLGPAAVETLGQSLVAEESKAELSPIPWLSLGMIRPAPLMRSLEASGVVLPVFVDPLRDVQEVSWQASEAGRGIVQGHGRVVVSPRTAERAK